MLTERDAEDGFTLVELMVVVLILGVLMVIAIPTMVGARERAMDRRTQANIRNALLAEKAYYSDSASYTDVPTDMTAIEAALDYLAGDTPVVETTVYLLSVPADDQIYISSKSESGTCFYLTEIAASGAEYATAADPACGAADLQTYGDRW
jgi:type IV pilus assembly protein PilA